jgi:hypothetical protein
MSGVISPLPQYPFMAWCSVKQKYRNNFTFTFTFVLYASPNVRVIKSKGARMRVTRVGNLRNSYKILVAESEGEKPLRRTIPRWQYSIRMDLREMGLEDLD